MRKEISLGTIFSWLRKAVNCMYNLVIDTGCTFAWRKIHDVHSIALSLLFGNSFVFDQVLLAGARECQFIFAAVCLRGNTNKSMDSFFFIELNRLCNVPSIQPIPITLREWFVFLMIAGVCLVFSLSPIDSKGQWDSKALTHLSDQHTTVTH